MLLTDDLRNGSSAACQSAKGLQPNGVLLLFTGHSQCNQAALTCQKSQHSARRTTGMLKSWRDFLQIHPAAELFPLHGARRATARSARTSSRTDSRRRSCCGPTANHRNSLLDGRNRLDAIEVVIGSPAEIGAPSIAAGKDFLARQHGDHARSIGRSRTPTSSPRTFIAGI